MPSIHGDHANEAGEKAGLGGVDEPSATAATAMPASEKTAPPTDAVHEDSKLASSTEISKDVATDEHTGGPSDDQDANTSQWKLLAIVVALCLAVFLVALDQTIVSTAIPRITDHFHSTADIGWYGASYLLTRAALTPTFGRIYSQFSVKYTFLTTIAIFELGSLVCATAQSSRALIVGRAVAGIGVGGLFTGSILIIIQWAPLRQRPLIFGIIGTMWSIASVAGPLMGGVFTDSISWRWCFYINLPVGAFAVALLALLLRMPGSDEPNKLSVWQGILKLDLLGAALTIPATICLILALQWGGSVYSWNDSRIIGLLVGAGCLSILLVYAQVRLGEHSTFPPQLMRSRDILCASLFACFFGAAFYPAIYYLALYFQSVRGSTAFHAGIQTLPLLISSSISSLATGALISATGYYNPFMIVCMALLIAGAACLSTLNQTTWYWRNFGYQILAGSGIGVGFEAGFIIAQNVAPPGPLIPAAIAIVGFTQTMGGTIFIAIAQTVFQRGLLQGIEDRAPELNPQTFLQNGATDVSALLASSHHQELLGPVLESYVEGIRNVYWLVTACTAVAFAAACGLRWKKLEE